MMPQTKRSKSERKYKEIKQTLGELSLEEFVRTDKEAISFNSYLTKTCLEPEGENALIALDQYCQGYIASSLAQTSQIQDYFPSFNMSPISPMSNRQEVSLIELTQQYTILSQKYCEGSI